MKNKILLLAFLLVTFTITAKAQFNFTLTPTHETCLNNGKIKVDITDTQNGAAFAIGLYDAAGTNLILPIISLNATGTTLTYTFNSLGHEDYMIKIKEDIYPNITEKEGTVTIENQMAELAFTADIEDTCQGLKITTNVAAGNPVKYRLIKKDDSSILVDWQNSNIFNLNTSDFNEGQYLLQVKDNCDETNVVELTLKHPKQPNYAVNRGSAHCQFKLLRDCHNFNHREMLQFQPGLDGHIPAYRYPIQVKIEVQNPYGSPKVINSQWNNPSIYAQNFQNIPFYPGKSYNYKVTFTDACGKEFVHSETIEGKDPRFHVDKEGGNCLYNNLVLSNFHYMAAPLKITFVNYPPGFKPSDFNNHFSGSNVSADFNEPFHNNPHHIINFENPAKTIPSGHYKIEIESCGKTAVEEIDITNDSEYRVHMHLNKYGCGENNAAIKMWIATNKSGNKADFIDEIIVTSAPQAFIDQFGSLPRDITAGHLYQGIFIMNSLPIGNYTVKLKGRDCGANLTKSFTLIKRKFDANVTINRKCSSFDVEVTATSNLYWERFYLQKYHEAQGKWGHPSDPTKLYNEGDDLKDNQNAQQMGEEDSSGPGSSSGEETTFTRELLNVIDQGKYRVMYSYATWGNGVYEGATCVGGVVGEEFTIYEPAITINNFNVLKCTEGGASSSTLLVDANGVEPLKYQIVAVNGIPTSAYPETTNPIFKNLLAAIYTIRITDDCGNTRNVELSTIHTRTPKIIPDNLCDGEEGKLFLSGVGFVTVKWFKDGNPTSIGTGNTYTFSPFNSTTDKGKYSVKLYYPAGEELCTDDEIFIDLTNITNTANAGIGKTANICSDTSVISLFDYLEGTYNNWGTWHDINTPKTGALNQDIVDIGRLMLISSQQGGTYQFKYHVKGYCTGQDETIVTLNVRPMPTFKLESENAKCGNEKSKIKVTITSGEGTYDVYLYKSSDATGTVIQDKSVTITATSSPEQKTVTFDVEESATYSVKVVREGCESICGE